MITNKISKRKLILVIWLFNQEKWLMAKIFDYQHIIIDEFQDISPATLKLIKSLRKTKAANCLLLEMIGSLFINSGDLKYFKL